MRGENEDSETASKGSTHGGKKSDINVYMTEDKVPIK